MISMVDVIYCSLTVLMLVSIFAVYKFISRKFSRGAFGLCNIFFYILIFFNLVYCFFCFYRLYKERVDALFFQSILGVNKNNIEKYAAILSVKNNVSKKIRDIDKEIADNKKLIEDINKKSVDDEKKYTNEPGKPNVVKTPLSAGNKVLSDDDIKKKKDLEEKNVLLEKEKKDYDDFLKDIDEKVKLFKDKTDEITKQLSACSVGFISSKNRKAAEEFIRKYEDEEHIFDGYVSDIESKFKSLEDKYKKKSDDEKNKKCEDNCKHCVADKKVSGGKKK